MKIAVKITLFLALVAFAKGTSFAQGKVRSDSVITHSKLNFTPGEFLAMMGMRLDTMGCKTIGKTDWKKDYLFIQPNVEWSGMMGRGVVTFDSLDFATLLRLDFKNETFDTLYLRLSRMYGLPEREIFLENDSIWDAIFREGDKMIELWFDSSVHYPTVFVEAAKTGYHYLPISRNHGWARLTGSSVSTYYVDTTVYSKDLIVIKDSPTDSTIRAIKEEAAIKYPRAGYENYAYGLFTYKCDCEKGTMATLRIIHCSSDDKPIYMYPPSPKWGSMKPVEEGTTTYRVFDYVCHKGKYQK
jgi:hypothetical protein